MAYRHRPTQPPAQPSLGRGLDGAGNTRVNRVNPVFPPEQPPMIPRHTADPAEAVLSSPLTEGTTDVRTDELSRSEETGRGIPSGGGSADDHPSGGSPSGSEAPVSSATDPAQTGDGVGADGPGAEQRDETGSEDLDA